MIKLLIVDDSPMIRRLLGDLFGAEGDFEVAFARDGVEALGAVRAFRPDVVTLDVHMPQMDGLRCLDQIMLEQPTPVVMTSGLTAAGAAETLRALELGAVDFIAKPSRALSLRMDAFGPLLVEKVRTAAGVRLSKTRRLRERLRARAGLDAEAPATPERAPGTETKVIQRGPRQRPRDRAPAPQEGLVLVGALTGGPPALDALLSALPAEFPWPIVIAQHMPATFTAALAQRLDGLTPLTVVEVSRPMVLRAGGVYVGRGDADVIVSRRAEQLVVMDAPADPAYRWRPSVDRLVFSALDHLPASHLVGVLLTGMGADGAAAMTRMRAEGGYAIAEAEETAVVWGMPGELVRAGGASLIAPREQIAQGLLAAVAS